MCRCPQTPMFCMAAAPSLCEVPGKLQGTGGSLQHATKNCSRQESLHWQTLLQYQTLGAMLTCSPEARRKAAMEAAKPTQVVLTCGLMWRMVSKTAIPGSTDAGHPCSVCHHEDVPA